MVYFLHKCRRMGAKYMRCEFGLTGGIFFVTVFLILLIREGSGLLPQGADQQKKKYIFYALSTAIHKERIAALLLSTQNALCSLFSAYSDNPRVSAIVQVRFLVPRYGKWIGSSYPRCRSPPSDFDFASYQLKNQNWRTP